MKLLSVNSAKSFWWGNISDLNPKGIAFYPLTIMFLIDAYHFKKYPSMTTPPQPPPGGEGFKFDIGEFKVKDGYTINVGLSLFTDSLMADTMSSTENADAFLADVLTRYTGIFQSPDYNEVIKRKTYYSEVYVSTDKKLQTVNPKLDHFTALLAETIPPTTAVQLGGISFWSETPPNMVSRYFTFERAIGGSFSDNRYYSSAPLPTNKHLELLDKLEDVLS